MLPSGDEVMKFAEIFRYVIDNYEPEFWWFESFDFLRRLALTGLMVVLVPGSALQSFIGVLIALGGLIAYLQWKPFVEDTSDWVAVCCQLSTFFVFLSALMIQVNAVAHRNGFAAVLSVVTLMPAFISMCIGYHTCRVAWMDTAEDTAEAEFEDPGLSIVRENEMARREREREIEEEVRRRSDEDLDPESLIPVSLLSRGAPPLDMEQPDAP